MYCFIVLHLLWRMVKHGESVDTDPKHVHVHCTILYTDVHKTTHVNIMYMPFVKLFTTRC